MGNIVTAFFAFFACFFFHFRENNDKVPKRSKNGPKKVPILPLRPEFCRCKDFLSEVPNPIFFFGAPEKSISTHCRPMLVLAEAFTPWQSLKEWTRRRISFQCQWRTETARLSCARIVGPGNFWKTANVFLGRWLGIRWEATKVLRLHEYLAGHGEMWPWG